MAVVPSRSWPRIFWMAASEMPFCSAIVAKVWRLCRDRHSRHAFAVGRLVSWYRQGADVQRLLPHLATYLGHVHLAATQRYLTLTPELLEQASQRFEAYAGELAHG
jgi:hypothetical protein